MCAAMDRADLADDPRFSTVAARAQRVQEVVKIVQDWVDAATDEEVQQALEKHRVPFAPILTVEQAMNHQHLRERRTVRTIKDRFLGDFDIPGFPMRFSDYGELDLEAPTLGEQNAEILREFLGYSAGKVDELTAAGVIHSGSR
jgi:CoA:oxalate CoA-transferase